MLNGLAPVLVYTYKLVDTSFSVLGYEVPSIGLPIPIYLDEKITGIMGEGASNKISIETATINNQTYTRQVGNDVSVKLRCRNNNLVGQTLIAILSEAFKYTSADKYSISLYYDSTFILDAYLKDFYSRPIDNTDMREIGITLSKKYKNTAMIYEVEPVENIIPLGD